MFRPMRQGFRSPPPVGPSPGPGPFPGAGPGGGGAGGTFPWGLPGNVGTPPYGVRHRAFTKSPQQQQQQQQPSPGLSPFHQHRYKSPSPGHQQPTPQSFTSRHSPRARGRYSSPSYHPHSPGQTASQQPSPGSAHRRYQGSPRTSTPFGGGGCIVERKSPAPVEQYYKPSMLQDPWADLEPVSASDINLQYGTPQSVSSTKRGRYFS